MFATFVGTDKGGSRHEDVFWSLYAIAVERGYVPGNSELQVEPDGPMDDWVVKQIGPEDGQAEFFLAVTEPQIPGCSPIFPVQKTVSGPMFAVVVLDSSLTVFREDRSDVLDVNDTAAVAESFESFLRELPAPHLKKDTLREKIPSLAYIEAQVVHQAVKRGALKDSVRAVETQYNFASGSLGDGVFLESRILSLLYCLVVVPREIWASSSEHPIYDMISKNWSVPFGAVIKPATVSDEKATYHFIRHLRNAVAHARFTFGGQRFHFWDQRPKEDMPSFRATISIYDLQLLLEVVGSAFANLRSA